MTPNMFIAVRLSTDLTLISTHVFRSLADLNADGKMDQKEFSIAVHLIKKKLQGYELPKALPPSLTADPGPGVAVAPMAAFSMPGVPVPHGQLGIGKCCLCKTE